MSTDLEAVVSAPLLSIITVTRNNLKGLEKTYASIQIQSLRAQIEWVVIDGLSQDGTQSFLKQNTLATDVWVSEKDAGLYDAMNKGIQRAKGTFLWFLNAGDELFAYNSVALLAHYMQSFDLLYGETMLVTETGKKIGTRSETTTRKLPAQLQFQSLLAGMVVNHQSVIVKKEICPPFSLAYKIAADYDWLCRLLKQPIRCKNTLLIHSNFELGGVSSQRKWLSWKERWRIMHSHFGLLQTLRAHLKIIVRALFNK